MRKIKLSFLLLLALCLSSPSAFADWEDTLKTQFDIVETFDNLQDWVGTQNNAVVVNPADLPKKADGSASMWGLYANGGGPLELQKWIGNHGADYTWLGSGKSACINYGILGNGFDIDGNPIDDPEVKGYGADVLATYIGDGTVTSGYRDIYLFFMMKFKDGYWTMNPDDPTLFVWPPAIKQFFIASGFTSIDNWGETACDVNLQEVYGTNYTLYNTSTYGGNVLTFANQLRTTIAGDSCWNKQNTDDYLSPEINMRQPILNKQWMGIEVHQDLGTVATADGITEMWLYDETGTQIGYYSTGPVVMQQEFTHNYNKIEFGGNYQTSDTIVLTGITDWYLDDVIIDGARIGPTYFGLLGKSATLTGTAVTGGVTETELAGDDQTVIITLDGDTFVADVCSASRLATACDGSLIGAGSWDDEATVSCVRDSDTAVTLTVATAAYNITQDETVTCTIPGAALTGASPIVASPVITITHLDPPVISGLGPTADQACTTDPRSVTIQATTDESATCKYSTTDTTYALMAGTMSGTTSHSATVASLDCGTTQTFYVLCTDTSGNVNTSSETFSFDIVASTEHIGSVQYKTGSGSVVHK